MAEPNKIDEIETIFNQTGGVFCTSAQNIADKLKNIKAFVFDWDGVFNNASKNEQKSSTFNEADSMGTNMLRFSSFLLNQTVPVTAIISGEKNDMALYFSKRECLAASYFKIPHKILALEHLCSNHNIKIEEVCYVFDDVLDLSIASRCGLRILINRKANPLFKNYIVKNNLADYITAHESGNFAVRETCELLIGLNQNYNQVMDERKDFSAVYANYFKQRQATQTSFFTIENGDIIEQEV